MPTVIESLLVKGSKPTIQPLQKSVARKEADKEIPAEQPTEAEESNSEVPSTEANHVKDTKDARDIKHIKDCEHAKGDEDAKDTKAGKNTKDHPKVEETPRCQPGSNIRVTVVTKPPENHFTRLKAYRERSFSRKPLPLQDDQFMVRGRQVVLPQYAPKGFIDSKGQIIEEYPIVDPTHAYSEPNMNDVKPGKSIRSTRSDWDERSIRLPALTIGCSEVLSSGDYETMNGRPLHEYYINDIPVAFPDQPTQTNRSTNSAHDEPEVLLARLKWKRNFGGASGGKKSGGNDSNAGYRNDLKSCLNVHQAGGTVSPMGSRDDVRLKHHTQFMQRHRMKNLLNPYRSMQTSVVGKNNQVVRYEFNCLDSYFNFNNKTCTNDNNSAGNSKKLQSGVMRAYTVNQHKPLLQRSMTDTSLLRVMLESNKPVSKGSRGAGSEVSVHKDLVDFVQITTPRFDPRIRKSAKSAGKNGYESEAPAETEVSESWKGDPAE